MLNENAKKWVAALRSGEFKQAQRKLATKDGFCCLGVACVLAEKDGLSLPDDWKDRGSLPWTICRWLGLRTGWGQYGPALENELTRDNDKKDKTFAEIAGIIESEPEGLFVPEAQAQ